MKCNRIPSLGATQVSPGPGSDGGCSWTERDGVVAAFGAGVPVGSGVETAVASASWRTGSVGRDVAAFPLAVGVAPGGAHAVRANNVKNGAIRSARDDTQQMIALGCPAPNGICPPLDWVARPI
jgi:hypothetical protein